MSRRTIFLIFGLFLITASLLIAGSYKSQIFNNKTTTVLKGSVIKTTLSLGDLSVVPSTSSSMITYSVPINISTNQNKVTAVQLEIQYNPEALTDVSVATGSFFPNPDVLLNLNDTKTGRISYSFSVGLTGQGVNGEGTVANITFSANPFPLRQTDLILLPKTLVTATGIRESVLKQINRNTLTIKELIPFKTLTSINKPGNLPN
jgi:hypothetical protein